MVRIIDSEQTAGTLTFNEYPVMENDKLINPSVSAEAESNEVYSILDNFTRIGRRCGRMKPSYADTWIVGSDRDLDVIEKYDTKSAKVKIGYASDGQLEYNITPLEYSFGKDVNSKITEAIGIIRKDFRKNGKDFTSNVNAEVKKVLGDISSDIPNRYTLGNGIFDILLDDERLEDVYVDAQYEDNRIFHMCQHM